VWFLGIKTRFGIAGRMLGPSKARLKKYIEEAEQLLSLPVEEKTMEEEVIEYLVERMDNNVSVVERCINDWMTLLRSLKEERKVTEEAEQS